MDSNKYLYIMYTTEVTYVCLTFYGLSNMSKDNLNHLNKSSVSYNKTFFKIIFRSVILAQV